MSEPQRPRAADGERDAWLREALRNAPDATIAPPPALSDLILREARIALPMARGSSAESSAASAPSSPSSFKPAATPSLASASKSRPTRSDFAGRFDGAGAGPTAWTAWTSLWAWLARPQVTASLASAMAATLVGMLWWDRPLDETAMPRSATPAPPAATERPTAQRQRETKAAGSKALADSSSKAPDAPSAPRLSIESPKPERSAVEPRPFSPTVTTPAAPAAATEAAAATAPGPAATRGQLQSPAEVEANANAKAKANARAQAEAQAGAGAGAAAGARAQAALSKQAPAAPGTNQAPAASPAAPPTASSRNEETVKESSAFPLAKPSALPGASRDANESARARSEDRVVASKDRPANAAPPMAAVPEVAPSTPMSRTAPSVRAATPSSAMAPTRQAPTATDAPNATPLATLLSAIDREPSRWSWQRGSSAEQPVDEPVRRWLGSIDERTSTASDSALAMTRRADGFAAPDAPSILQLFRDGRLHTTLRIDGARLNAETIGEPGSNWQLPLSPSAASALRSTMPVSNSAR